MTPYVLRVPGARATFSYILYVESVFMRSIATVYCLVDIFTTVAYDLILKQRRLQKCLAT